MGRGRCDAGEGELRLSRTAFPWRLGGWGKDEAPGKGCRQRQRREEDDGGGMGMGESARERSEAGARVSGWISGRGLKSPIDVH